MKIFKSPWVWGALVGNWLIIPVLFPITYNEGFYIGFISAFIIALIIGLKNLIINFYQKKEI